MQHRGKYGFAISPKESMKLAAVSMAVLALVGCGGGDGVVDAGGNVSATESKVIVDVSATQTMQPNKGEDDSALWVFNTPELTEKQIAKRDELEIALMEKAKDAGAIDKSASDYELAMTKGFDAAANYSVGYLTADVGPGGDSIKKRAKTASKSLSFATDATKADFNMPDMIYLRAGQIKPTDVLNSAVFKQAVAQGKAIMVEREAVGRKQYENLLYNVFNFSPAGTDAVVLVAASETGESWLVYPLDPDDQVSEDDDGTNKAVVDASAPYSINMNAVASILKGAEIKSKAQAAGQPAIRIGEAPEESKAVKSTIWGKYITGWNTSGIYGEWWADPHSYIVNGKTWKWEERSDVCTWSTCGAYGSSYFTYNITNPQLAKIAWWDSAVFCGVATKIDKNVTCNTGYEMTTSRTTGSTNKVGVEYGVSITAEGEAGIPFVTKAKVSTTAHSTFTYGHEWSKTKSTTFTTRMNISMPKGYAARIGRGDYTADVSQWLRGRHERSAAIGGSGCQHLGTSYYGDARQVHFNTYNCPSKWDGGHKQKIGQSKFKAYGVKMNVVCKQADGTCMALMNRMNGTDWLEKKFPL